MVSTLHTLAKLKLNLWFVPQTIKVIYIYICKTAIYFSMNVLTPANLKNGLYMVPKYVHRLIYVVPYICCLIGPIYICAPKKVAKCCQNIKKKNIATKCDLPENICLPSAHLWIFEFSKQIHSVKKSRISLSL